jgi:L-fucose isomerase-like protein
MSCWPQFQEDYNLAVCSVMGHLNTGGLIAACEGDLTSAVSMLALRYLTNGQVITLMDLVSIDNTDESVLLWHCGPTSPALADENGVTIQPLWLFDGPDGKRTGLHNDLVLRPGIGTVLGFTTDFNGMLILEGEIDNAKPSYMGSRGWLTNIHLNSEKITTPDLVQTLMVSGYQHHYPFAYGYLGEAGLELCGWLGIHPVPKENYTPYIR